MAAKSMKEFLSYLSHLSQRQLKSFLSTASRSQILLLREVTVNALKGNLHLGSDTVNQLLPHKKFLRDFANKGVSRRILTKKYKALHILLKASHDIIQSKL